MQITYFRLKGYINILQGMGQDEIIIPFNQFHNRIILIQGENGAGKSTILKALSPNPDSADSFRTDVMINNGVQQIVEYPGEKEIHYKDDLGNVYKVLIQSVVDESRTRRTTKAYISKNGEEFNPNGTVSGFKEARDNLLGIDPVYLDMSAISSENRGLVDMIPSERRKYLSSYIGSVETFNEIYKVISKKASACKSYLNSLNTKIYSMGNELELRTRLAQLEDRLSDLNKQRDDLLKSQADAEAVLRMIDPDNKIQDLYVSISDRLGTIKSDLRKNQEFIEDLRRDYAENSKNEDFDISKEILEVDEYYNKNKKSIDDYTNKVAGLIALNEETETSLNRDKSRLLSISSESIHENLEAIVQDTKDQIDFYKDYLGSTDPKIYETISIEDFRSIKDNIEKFISVIDQAKDVASSEEILLMAIDNDDLNNQINNIQNSISKYSLELKESNNNLESLKNIKDRLNNFESLRPKNCVDNDCPFISEYIKLSESHKNIDNEIDSLNDNIQSLSKSIDELNIELSRSLEALDLQKSIDQGFKLIESSMIKLSIVPDLEYFSDKNKIKEKIKLNASLNSVIVLLNDYISKATIYDDLKKVQKQYDSLYTDLKVYQSNKSIIDSLNDSINSMEKDIEDRKRDIQKYTKEIDFLNKIVDQLLHSKTILNDLKQAEEKDKSLSEELNQLRLEYSKIKDNIRIVKEKSDNLNDIKNQLELINKTIEPVSEDINQIKFNIANVIAYQAEFKEYSDKYEKLSFIKDACSPGSGKSIQSEYVKMYMNDIIMTCNTLLGYMFNGTIRLDVPVINEKQFSIPFIGPNGFKVPDISNGSTAQKCMIGLVFSCVSMMKSSSTYNIPRFDEIDGGLDQQNRIVFINVINQILDIMKAKQCIMVSHNNEFDTQSTTIVRCDPNGLSFLEYGQRI